jgi:predicted P-loop ATPase
MNVGGGKDIADVLRQLGKEALVREAENAGLKPRNGRMRCPYVGCRDKAEKGDTVQLYPGKRDVWRAKCHRCGQDGSLVDVLAALRGWTDQQAIAHLHGLPAPASKPPLHLVQPEPAPAADKLTPEQVRSLWQQFAKDDPEGRAYLEGRGLADAIDLGLVRFTTAAHPNATVKYWHRDKRLVVALLKTVTGNEAGVQGRLVRALKPGEKKKCISIKGSNAKRAFFGAPELIESSPVIAVAEGLPDTLALAGWARGNPVTVVGAAGMDALPEIANELKRCDISVEGRLFVLFPQNDAPLNKSRAAFDRLGQLLHREGARVVMVSTDAEYKDLADWLKAFPDAAWPPPALAQVLGGDPDAGEVQAPAFVEPSRGSLPIQDRIRVDVWGQNFSTLCSILDDPLHREAVMGRRGELAFNEMTGELDFCGRELDDSDLAGIRLRIELHAKTPEGKILKFKKEDIWDALAYLSKRRKMHPLREWLTSLKWDGRDRLTEEMPRAFGHEHGLEAHILRKWFISAAARGIEPGCKVDTVLVLQGDEGLKKSTLFRMLAGGPQYFTSSPVKIGEPDGFALLRRKWIVEWPELDSMKRARDQESIKAFLSNAADDYRPKWGRGQISVARSCVLVGTTNEKKFLQGEMNRRFWIVEVPRLDFQWLKDNREQLWAQAAHLYFAAFDCPDCKPLLPDDRCDEHKWWLEKDYEEVHRAANLKHVQEDEWVSVIADWIEKESAERVANLSSGEPVQALQVHEVLEKAIGKPPGQWTQGKDANRVVDALKKLGWTGPKRRWRGRVGRFWMAPGHQLELGEEDQEAGE